MAPKRGSAKTVQVHFEIANFKRKSNEPYDVGISGSLEVLGKWDMGSCLMVKESAQKPGTWEVDLEMQKHQMFQWRWVVLSKEEGAVLSYESGTRKATIGHYGCRYMVPNWGESEEVIVNYPVKANSVEDVVNGVTEMAAAEPPAQKPQAATTPSGTEQDNNKVILEPNITSRYRMAIAPKTATKQSKNSELDRQTTEKQSQSQYDLKKTAVEQRKPFKRQGNERARDERLIHSTSAPMTHDSNVPSLKTKPETNKDTTQNRKKTSPKPTHKTPKNNDIVQAEKQPSKINKLGNQAGQDVEEQLIKSLDYAPEIAADGVPTAEATQRVIESLSDESKQIVEASKIVPGKTNVAPVKDDKMDTITTKQDNPGSVVGKKQKQNTKQESNKEPGKRKSKSCLKQPKSDDSVNKSDVPAMPKGCATVGSYIESEKDKSVVFVENPAPSDHENEKTSTNSKPVTSEQFASEHETTYNIGEMKQDEGNDNQVFGACKKSTTSYVSHEHITHSEDITPKESSAKIERQHQNNPESPPIESKDDNIALSNPKQRDAMQQENNKEVSMYMKTTENIVPDTRLTETIINNQPDHNELKCREKDTTFEEEEEKTTERSPTYEIIENTPNESKDSTVIMKTPLRKDANISNDELQNKDAKLKEGIEIDALEVDQLKDALQRKTVSSDNDPRCLINAEQQATEDKQISDNDVAITKLQDESQERAKSPNTTADDTIARAEKALNRISKVLSDAEAKKTARDSSSKLVNIDMDNSTKSKDSHSNGSDKGKREKSAPINCFEKKEDKPTVTKKKSVEKIINSYEKIETTASAKEKIGLLTRSDQLVIASEGLQSTGNKKSSSEIMNLSRDVDKKDKKPSTHSDVCVNYGVSEDLDITNAPKEKVNTLSDLINTIEGDASDGWKGRCKSPSLESLSNKLRKKSNISLAESLKYEEIIIEDEITDGVQMSIVTYSEKEKQNARNVIKKAIRSDENLFGKLDEEADQDAASKISSIEIVAPTDESYDNTKDQITHIDAVSKDIHVEQISNEEPTCEDNMNSEDIQTPEIEYTTEAPTDTEITNISNKPIETTLIANLQTEDESNLVADTKKSENAVENVDIENETPLIDTKTNSVESSSSKPSLTNVSTVICIDETSVAKVNTLVDVFTKKEADHKQKTYREPEPEKENFLFVRTTKTGDSDDTPVKLNGVVDSLDDIKTTDEHTPIDTEYTEENDRQDGTNDLDESETIDLPSDEDDADGSEIADEYDDYGKVGGMWPVEDDERPQTKTLEKVNVFEVDMELLSSNDEESEDGGKHERAKSPVRAKRDISKKELAMLKDKKVERGQYKSQESEDDEYKPKQRSSILQLSRQETRGNVTSYSQSSYPEPEVIQYRSKNVEPEVERVHYRPSADEPEVERVGYRSKHIDVPQKPKVKESKVETTLYKSKGIEHHVPEKRLVENNVRDMHDKTKKSHNYISWCIPSRKQEDSYVAKSTDIVNKISTKKEDTTHRHAEPVELYGKHDIVKCKLSRGKMGNDYMENVRILTEENAFESLKYREACLVNAKKQKNRSSSIGRIREKFTSCVMSGSRENEMAERSRSPERNKHREKITTRVESKIKSLEKDQVGRTVLRRKNPETDSFETAATSDKYRHSGTILRSDEKDRENCEYLRSVDRESKRDASHKIHTPIRIDGKSEIKTKKAERPFREVVSCEPQTASDTHEIKTKRKDSPKVADKIQLDNKIEKKIVPNHHDIVKDNKQRMPKSSSNLAKKREAPDTEMKSVKSAKLDRSHPQDLIPPSKLPVSLDQGKLISELKEFNRFMESRETSADPTLELQTSSVISQVSQLQQEIEKKPSVTKTDATLFPRTAFADKIQHKYSSLGSDKEPCTNSKTIRDFKSIAAKETRQQSLSNLSTAYTEILKQDDMCTKLGELQTEPTKEEKEIETPVTPVIEPTPPLSLVEADYCQIKADYKKIETVKSVEDNLKEAFKQHTNKKVFVSSDNIQEILYQSYKKSQDNKEIPTRDDKHKKKKDHHKNDKVEKESVKSVSFSDHIDLDDAIVCRESQEPQLIPGVPPEPQTVPRTVKKKKHHHSHHHDIPSHDDNKANPYEFGLPSKTRPLQQYAVDVGKKDVTKTSVGYSDEHAITSYELADDNERIVKLAAKYAEMSDVKSKEKIHRKKQHKSLKIKDDGSSIEVEKVKLLFAKTMQEIDTLNDTQPEVLVEERDHKHHKSSRPHSSKHKHRQETAEDITVTEDYTILDQKNDEIARAKKTKKVKEKIGIRRKSPTPPRLSPLPPNIDDTFTLEEIPSPQVGQSDDDEEDVEVFDHFIRPRRDSLTLKRFKKKSTESISMKEDAFYADTPTKEDSIKHIEPTVLFPEEYTQSTRKNKQTRTVKFKEQAKEVDVIGDNREKVKEEFQLIGDGVLIDDSDMEVDVTDDHPNYTISHEPDLPISTPEKPETKPEVKTILPLRQEMSELPGLFSPNGMFSFIGVHINPYRMF